MKLAEPGRARKERASRPPVSSYSLTEPVMPET